MSAANLSTRAAQAAHYAGVRARLLRGPPPRQTAPSDAAVGRGDTNRLGASTAGADEQRAGVSKYFPTPFDFFSPPGWRQLVEFCALVHGVAAADITGPTRLRHIMPARHHAVFLCATHTTLSGSDIARRFRRDHSTVIHSVKMWGKLRYSCPPGGHVLDVFAGSGTVGLAARRNDMAATLVEGNIGYAAIANARMADDVPLLRDAHAGAAAAWDGVGR